jgi:hypothetical protein
MTEEPQGNAAVAGQLERGVSRLLPKRACADARGFTRIELLIVMGIMASIGILAAVIVPDWLSRNDQTETLKTKDWQCLKEEERTYTYPMLVGKVTIMQTGRRMECVEWRRVAG